MLIDQTYKFNQKDNTSPVLEAIYMYLVNNLIS